MSVFTGQTASVYVTGTPLTLTSEATTDVGALHTTYQITNAAKRVVNRDYAVLVEQSPSPYSVWTTVPSTNYTFKHLSGQVVLTSAIGATDHIRISGQYLPLSIAGNATDWALTMDANLVTTTVLHSSWKSQQAVVKEGTVKFSQFYADSSFFVLVGTKLVVILWIDETNGIGYRTYCWLKNDSIKVMEEDVIKEDLNFDVDLGMEYQSTP